MICLPLIIFSTSPAVLSFPPLVERVTRSAPHATCKAGVRAGQHSGHAGGGNVAHAALFGQ